MAQQGNAVLEHYRAYRAALEADDLAGAEREAGAALASSEARDGDGGRTAVLALNLATVRLLRDDAAGALAPGRRALSLAQTQGEQLSGVSPALAQLIVSRAELATGDESAVERLAIALDAARQARISPEEIYDAATQLAVWTFSAERYEDARQASAIAVAYAEGSRLPEAYARATALTREAAALVLADLSGGRPPRLSEEAGRDAYTKLSWAIVALRPLAEINSEGEVTPAQRSYAQALAWRAVIRAKMRADGLEIPTIAEAQGDADGMSEVDVPVSLLPQPRCLVRILPRDSVRLYPEGALASRRLAGLAVRFRVNDAGHVTEVQTLASVGGAEFEESVEYRRNWRVERRRDSPPNCRMAMSVIQSISFSIG